MPVFKILTMPLRNKEHANGESVGREGSVSMSDGLITVRPVTSAADRKAFVELPFRLYSGNPSWVPPLRMDVNELINEKKNPWFEHGEAQLFLAERENKVVGRISAQIDQLSLAQPSSQGFGPGVGAWGFFEVESSEIAEPLFAAAEDWLRSKGMSRMIGPMSFCMWDETGLLVEGFDHPPVVMMAYSAESYPAIVEEAGHKAVQDLYTYQLPIADGFSELVNRIVAMGEKSERIRIRQVSKAKFDQEVQIVLDILNDAWSNNWGFTPFTEAEKIYIGKKLKPLVFEDLIMIAEVDGDPKAFMMTVPDLNEQQIKYGGNLFPFNIVRLLWWLRKPKVRMVRVPLMGVKQELQSTRMASQLAMMMIEFIRRKAVPNYGATMGDFGWVLASNGPMRSVGEAVGGKVNKIYRLYEKAL